MDRRQLTLGALDRVLDRRVDLVLHRAFLGPTCRHGTSSFGPILMASPASELQADDSYRIAASATGRIAA